MTPQEESRFGIESRRLWQASVGDDSSRNAITERLRDLAAGRPALDLVIGSDFEQTKVDSGRDVLVHDPGSPPSDRAHNDLVRFGNVLTVDLGTRYGLIHLPGPGLFALDTQEQQIRCFKNAGRCLLDEGLLVVETASSLSSWIDNGKCWAIDVGPDSVTFLVKRANPVEQLIAQSYVELRDDAAPVVRSAMRRYASPAEMDVMALMAGFDLIQRWGNWEGHAFTAASRKVISIYRRSGSALDQGHSTI